MKRYAIAITMTKTTSTGLSIVTFLSANIVAKNEDEAFGNAYKDAEKSNPDYQLLNKVVLVQLTKHHKKN